MKAAEDEVGVGDGGLLAAAVAGWTGIGAGGLWTDLQRAGGVHPREGASPGAGCVDVEHGDADGKAFDLAFAGGWRFAAGVKKCNVGGCSTHIEGEDLINAGGTGNAERADDAAGRAGEDGADGLARSGCGREDAARGLHDAESGVATCQTAFERVDVALHLWGKVGVEGDGGTALVFAEFGKDLM